MPFLNPDPFHFHERFHPIHKDHAETLAFAAEEQRSRGIRVFLNLCPLRLSAPLRQNHLSPGFLHHERPPCPIRHRQQPHRRGHDDHERHGQLCVDRVAADGPFGGDGEADRGVSEEWRPGLAESVFTRGDHRAGGGCAHRWLAAHAGECARRKHRGAELGAFGVAGGCQRRWNDQRRAKDVGAHHRCLG